MRIERRHTTAETSPYDGIEFRTTRSEIRNPDGSTVFALDGIDVPASWSQVAADVLAQKYFRKAGVPSRLKPVEEPDVPAFLWRRVADEAALEELPKAERFGSEKSARQVFDRGMPTPNQIDRMPDGGPAQPEELVALPGGPITEEGVRRNVRVSLRYLESWLRGIGCVPIDHLMEDAATVEIARSQLWQWIHHGARSEDGRAVDVGRFRAALAVEVALLRDETPAAGRESALERAVGLLDEAVTARDLEEFITSRAYDRLDWARGGAG